VINAQAIRLQLTKHGTMADPNEIAEEFTSRANGKTGLEALSLKENYMT
jgi:hypothetical protein